MRPSEVWDGIGSSVSGCPNRLECHCFVRRPLGMFEADKSLQSKQSQSKQRWVDDSGVLLASARTSKHKQVPQVLSHCFRVSTRSKSLHLHRVLMRSPNSLRHTAPARVNAVSSPFLSASLLLSSRMTSASSFGAGRIISLAWTIPWRVI